jgi:hypothetical protein
MPRSAEPACLSESDLDACDFNRNRTPRGLADERCNVQRSVAAPSRRGVAFRVKAPAGIDACSRFQLWRSNRRDARDPAHVQHVGG